MLPAVWFKTPLEAPSMSSASAPSSPSPPSSDPCSSQDVVFFDGVCGLCNYSVDFILSRDHKHLFRFAPLQGETARQQLSAEELQRRDTLVLRTKSAIYRRSAAVVRILWELPGIWPCLGWCLWLVPLPLRDLGYRVVSANRLSLFGQKETCRLPTPEERDRFLP